MFNFMDERNKTGSKLRIGNVICCHHCDNALDYDEIEVNKRVKMDTTTCRECYYINKKGEDRCNSVD